VTHDELLAKVDTLEARYTDYSTYLALRAVVELHNPVGVICSWCTCHEDNHIVEYPCKTIRAIETALV
jgi:hypothetical protein